jgi:hypothetical protein
LRPNRRPPLNNWLSQLLWPKPLLELVINRELHQAIPVMQLRARRVCRLAMRLDRLGVGLRRNLVRELSSASSAS